MQKIKWILMTIAVILGIGGAILTRPHAAAPTTGHFSAAESCVYAQSGETPQPAAHN